MTYLSKITLILLIFITVPFCQAQTTTGEKKEEVLTYKGSAGPENALFSLLVPGLGDHRVTFGKKKGIGIALATYGLIGTGVGLKLYSNSEYKKYHAATEQSAMDKHYDSANNANKYCYVFIGAGAAVWIYDIIWVAVKGAKNKKEQNAWKQSHVGLYYNPEWKATGLTLTYTINY